MRVQPEIAISLSWERQSLKSERVCCWMRSCGVRLSRGVLASAGWAIRPSRTISIPMRIKAPRAGRETAPAYLSRGTPPAGSTAPNIQRALARELNGDQKRQDERDPVE